MNLPEPHTDIYRKSRTYCQGQTLVQFLKQMYLENSSKPYSNVLPIDDRKVLQAFIRLAEGNSVSMAFILALNSCSDFNNESFDCKRIMVMGEEAQRFFRSTLELMRIVVQGLEQEELPILTIKSFLPFPYADSNIDVVAVNNDSLTAYQDLLDKMGFYRLTRRANRTDFREPKKKMYTYMVNRDTKYPQLHLHRAISWNGIDYLNLKTVWDRRRSYVIEDLTIPIPSREDEVLIMAAHSIFENKYITIGELIHLSTLVSDEFDWNYAIRQTEIFHWASAFSLWLETVDPLCDRLDLKIDIPEWIYDKMSSKESTTVCLSESEHFPYIYPYISIVRVLLNKFILDAAGGKLKQLPRQLFSYLIVDLVWAYRNALRKRFKSNVLFDRWGMH